MDAVDHEPPGEVAPSSPVAWQPLLSSRAVDLPRMMSVAFTPMAPALRNELITEAYGDLATAMADCLGTTDATWCTFGQWASHAIGNYLGTVSIALVTPIAFFPTSKTLWTAIDLRMRPLQPDEVLPGFWA